MPNDETKLKQRYYYYTATSFTEESHADDKEAVATLKPEVVRVMRAQDSTDIWNKEVASA